MLITFIIAFSCLLTQIFGHNVYINNKENKDEYKLYMGPTNNYVTVCLIDNEIPKGTWILDNIEELEKYDISPRNLVGINQGRTVENDVNKEAGGYVIFNFNKGNITLEEYPKLKFVYQNELSENDGAEVIVNIVETPKLHYEDNLRVNRIEDHSINSVDLKIDNKDDFILNLTNDKYSDYNWYLENASEIEENPNIELLMTTSSIGYYEFVFRAKDIPNNALLPTLIFSEKKFEKDEKETANRIYNVNLNLKRDYLIEFEEIQNEIKKQNVTLYKNETFVVALNVTSTEDKWFLENIELLDEYIEPLVLGEEGEGQFFTYENEETDVVGTYKFKFLTKETIPSEYITSLKFIESKNKTEEEAVISKVEVSIKIKKDRTQEEIDNLPFRELSCGGSFMSSPEVTVESNILLLVTSQSNSSTGERYMLDNLEEIERSDFIDFVEKRNFNDCPKGIVGCGGSATHVFRIWEVSEGDVLPQLKFYNPNFKDRDFTVTLIPKSTSDEPVICKSGYPCCSDANAKIRYADSDGYWGVENGDWCIIPKKRLNKKVYKCTCREIEDYPCCRFETDIAYIDNQGEFGVEDDNWCVIPNHCDYKEYPVCLETTKVSYTDSDEWGIEYGKWCIKA